MKKVFLSLSVLLLGSIAQAHFDLAPQAPTTEAADRKLAEALKMPQACRPAAREISLALFNYEQSVRDRTVDKNYPVPNDEKALRRDLIKISSILKNAENKRPACFAPLSVFYALHSAVDDFSSEGLLPSLYLDGALKPLSLKSRRSLGGQWSLRLPGSGMHKILGGYDCRKSVIYFDPYAAPYDVWSILQHEVDHLLRDKYVDPKAIGLTTKEYLLVDELLSSMRAGYEEFADRTVMPTKLDITLYDYWGNMAGILLDRGERSWAIEAPYDTFSGYLTNAAFDSKATARMQDLISMVAKVYFQNTALDTATLIDKLRKIPIRALLPLEEDASRYAIKPLAYSDRQRIESSLSAPAPACQAFTDSVSSGELNNYLGAKVAAPQTRQKHKGDHTKYGKKPVKPVTEEVKPGTEGVKPGTEGVKPGAAGMRPCIHPAKGF